MKNCRYNTKQSKYCVFIHVFVERKTVFSRNHNHKEKKMDKIKRIFKQRYFHYNYLSGLVFLLLYSHWNYGIVMLSIF